MEKRILATSNVRTVCHAAWKANHVCRTGFALPQISESSIAASAPMNRGRPLSVLGHVIPARINYDAPFSAHKANYGDTVQKFQEDGQTCFNAILQVRC